MGGGKTRSSNAHISFFTKIIINIFLHENVWLLLKNDLKWKANTPMQRSSKKIRTDESGAYTSSSNANSSFDMMIVNCVKFARLVNKHQRRERERENQR